MSVFPQQVAQALQFKYNDAESKKQKGNERCTRYYMVAIYNIYATQDYMHSRTWTVVQYTSITILYCMKDKRIVNN